MKNGISMVLVQSLSLLIGLKQLLEQFRRIHIISMPQSVAVIKLKLING
jgi:hypothetical protein